MTGQSRKHRGYRTQKVVADWFRDSGLVHDLGPTTIDRLVARLEVAASGCWEWQGAKTTVVVATATGERGVDLARQYGVHKSAIYSIRKRKTWRHVA